jgi:hypothetical protein
MRMAVILNTFAPFSLQKFNCRYLVGSNPWGLISLAPDTQANLLHSYTKS